MIDTEQIRRFCAALFGGPNGDGDDRLAGLHVAAAWSLPGRETRWRRGEDLDAIVSAITELAEEQGTPGGASGIYIGPGLTRIDKGRYKRPGADDVVAIPGVWADIDVAGGPHTSKPYPPDIESAIKVASATGAVPTATIRTGFGIHCWWLFPEPYIIEPGDGEDAEREKLARLCQDWSSTLRYHAERLGGWKIDSVFNLDRVLRVPGTMNLRVDGDPRRAEIHELDETRRYELDDLAELFADKDVLDAYATGVTGGKVIELSGVNLGEVWARVNSPAYRENGYTPQWIGAVLEVDGDAGPFSLAWAGSRKDLGNDPSSYDAAVARMLHDFGCSTEKQVEAIMCRRLRSGEKVEKVDPRQRTDYIARTIGFVQESARRKSEVNPSAVSTMWDAVFARGASGRMAATVTAEPEPDAADYDWSSREAPPEDEEPPADPFAAYVADVLGHDADKPTPAERAAAAARQVEDEHGVPDADREPPVTELPDGVEELPRSVAADDEEDHWGPRSPDMVAMMEALSDLLVRRDFRERGIEVWRLERQDQGEGARGRFALRIPEDYDWPESRPEQYRVNRPLFTDWYKRAAFNTPKGFREALATDCLIPAAPVGNKEQWSNLIDALVQFWLRDSTGSDLAYSVHGWLLEYLMDHPATLDAIQAKDMNKPYLKDHREWGVKGLPLLLFSLKPFLGFLSTRPGGPKGRQAGNDALKYLRVTKHREWVTDKDGRKSRPNWYVVDHAQFSRDEWFLIMQAARDAFNARENRGLRVVSNGETA